MEPDPVFQRALDNFKKDLTAQQRHDFKITTLQDVKDEVNNIQIRYGSAKKLRGMSRMSKFLEAMQQLEQVISVFLNVSEVVAFIWGPIKFFLVVASSRLEILECLLDTFTDISEVMPDLQGYISIFEDQPEVLEVLKRCYGDIIQFYHMAFGILGRPGAFGIRDWRRMFDSFWKTFRTKFSPILGSLRRHRELLEQVKSTATFAELQKTRLGLENAIEKSKEELKQVLDIIYQKRKKILEKLGSQGNHDGKGHQRLPDRRYPTSGDWILKEHLFLQWLDPNNVSNDLLYLNGMPGAGKTTLVSRIMDSLTKDATAQQRPLLNFYFEHGQSGKTLLKDLLRSFIEQLLQQDDDIVDDLHEAVLPARPSDLSNLSWLEDIANRTILAQKRCYIIVDGLDECESNERKNILGWLKTVMSESEVSKVVVKVLVSSQRDGVIDAMLHDCAFNIRLDNETPHLRDIESFASSKVNEIREKFPGLEDEEGILQRLEPSRISKASKGMFMYAKVVLDNFLSQTSIYELEQELEREYPHGLDEAYDRVAERVLEKTSDARKQAALKILGLIACAARPLKWREIQCYFCIDAMKGSCDPRRRKVGGPKDLCSSFVESEACTLFPNLPFEAQLVMVHKTAKSYLLQSGRLDMAQQHMQMSLFCFQYLTRTAFDMVSQDSKVARTIALTGFYGFFDYAAAHWDHHSLRYAREASSRKSALSTEEGLGKLPSTAWMDFVTRFSDANESQSETISEHDMSSDISVPQPAPPGIIDTEGESCNIQEIFRDWSSTRQSTEFEKLAKSLHHIMQLTDLGTLGDREKAVYLSLNGPFRPKCSRRDCLHFDTGFDCEAELSQHISWHEMAFKCPHTGCHAWKCGFPTSASLQRHLNRVHPTIDSNEKLFPAKSRRPPRTIMEACRLGDMEWIQRFAGPMLTKEDLPKANKALHTAAKDGNLAVCVLLTQLGANPYLLQSSKNIAAGSDANIRAIQISIRLGDYDLFSALRDAAGKQHEIGFIECVPECVTDALESPNHQFLVDLLAWNGRRAVPLTLNDILVHAGMEIPRQEYGHRKLSFITRPVLIENRSVQERLQTLISSELEMYRKRGQSPEDCYDQVLIAADANGRSLLHRLCDGSAEYTSSGAVKFLFTKLKPEDTRRHDLRGNPPLFTALQNRSRCEGSALEDQENIIRSFFLNDLDAAKNTRNAVGNDPLVFAFRHATIQILPLAFELCGADYSILQSYRVWGIPSDCDFDEILEAVGLDRIDERSHLIAELSPKEVIAFAGLLVDLNIEPEVLKTLEFLIHQQPQSAVNVRPEPLNAPDTLRAILQPHNSNATKFLLSLKGAETLAQKYRSQLEALGPAELRKFLFVCLEANTHWHDVAKILLTQHKLDFTNARLDEKCPIVHELAPYPDMDPELISLLEQHEGYTKFSSRIVHNQIIETLSHDLYVSRNARAQFPDERRDYVESLLQYADSKEEKEFAASLNWIKRSFSS